MSSRPAPMIKKFAVRESSGVQLTLYLTKLESRVVTPQICDIQKSCTATSTYLLFFILTQFLSRISICNLFSQQDVNAFNSMKFIKKYHSIQIYV